MSASSDRIPCINPTCRRTAAAEKFEAGEEIVCGKCWKLLPKALTDRYRQIRRRLKRIDRINSRRLAKNLPSTMRPYELAISQCWANWRQIRAYFLNPPAPAGLENVLKEIGLA